MAKVFEINADIGYFDTVTNLVPDTKTVPIDIDIKGKCFKNTKVNSIRYNSYDWTSKFTNECWVECSYKLGSRPEINLYGNIFRSDIYGGANTFQVCFFNANVYFMGSALDNSGANGFYVLSQIPKFNVYYHLIVGYVQSTNKIYCYINGSLVSTTTPTKVLKMPTVGSKQISGYLNDGDQACKSYINYVRVYDTMPNINTVYQEFLGKKNKIISINKQYAKSTKNSEAGLVAHYIFNDKNIKRLTDISGNGNHGALSGNSYGIIKSKNGISYDRIAISNGFYTTSLNVNGYNKLSVCGILKKIKTVSNIECGVWYPDHQFIVDWFQDGKFYVFVGGIGNYASTNNTFSTGTITYTVLYDGTGTTNSDKLKLYINGILQPLSYTGTLISSISTTVTWLIGKGNSYSYGNSTEIEQKIYNRVLSDTEAKTYHNNWASKPIIIEQFMNDGSDSITKGLDRELIKKSGTFKVVKNTLISSIVNVGQNYLEAVTAGLISIPSNIAYGTWEFSIYLINTINIGFINNNISNNAADWSLQLYGTPDYRLLILYNSAGGYCQTAAGGNFTLSLINKWTRWRITRSLTGVFTLYMKTEGSSNFSLVNLGTGATGTNPFTNNTLSLTSKYININMGTSGNRIADIKIYPSIAV